jgi:uncharacterized protein YjbI with pentapeptide repeats
MVPTRKNCSSKMLVSIGIFVMMSLNCQEISRAGILAVPDDSKDEPNDRCELTIPRLGNEVIKGQMNVDTFLNAAVTSDALEGADMLDCEVHTSFAHRIIRGMRFESVVAKKADFSHDTYAQRVYFVDSDLTEADLSNSHFEGATFQGHPASLRNARLDGTNLWGATFEGVDMNGADLAGAKMTGVEFSPHDLPDIPFMAEATDLETLRAQNRLALFRLSKEFSDRGLYSRAADVTLALRRSEQDLYRYQCKTGFKDYGKSRDSTLDFAKRAGACVYFYTRALALDATCEFGRSPWRPIAIIGVLAILWTLSLWIWLLIAYRPGITLVFKSRNGDDSPIPVNRLIGRAYGPSKRPAARFRIAASLAISSVFNLPFKDLEVGRWLRLLSIREFEFRTRGAVRTFVGCLSLLCFYLLALSILSFFGAPFSR